MAGFGPADLGSNPSRATFFIELFDKPLEASLTRSIQ